MIKWMDFYHGMISVVLDSSPEAMARRYLYGKAGCYRPRTYGVEYRTLSNFWCKTEVLMKLMWCLTNDLISRTVYWGPTELDAVVTQDVINTNDQAFATEIINELCWPNFSELTRQTLKEAGYER
jgi:hypothetical protein